MEKMTMQEFCQLVGKTEDEIKKGSLYLRNCTSLTQLPEGMTVCGDLYLTDCTSLTQLPKGLKVGDWLDLTGCTSLTQLPEGIKIRK